MNTTERVTINPVVENPTLQPLDLVGLDRSWGIYLLEHDYTPPDLDTQHGGNVDSEGDVVVQSKWKNRTITEKVRIFEPTDPAATNIATNPLGALAVTGWAGVSLVAGPTRVLPTVVPAGLGIDTAIEAKTNLAADYLYLDTAVVNGKTYRASFYVQLAAATGGAAVRPVVYNAAGAVKKQTGAVEVNTVDLEGWVRLDVAFTADASATWRIGIEQVAGGTATVRVTGVLVEESATLGPFFCGDSPGCDWSGARHASGSTRPAPDGTRFSRIVRDVTATIDLIKRSKAGTLRRYSALGGSSPITYDLLSAKIPEAPQTLDIARRRAELVMSFEAEPGGRGVEGLIATVEETTKPVLTLLAENVPGDMPGLGRFQLSDLQGVDQIAAWWGAQQRNYDPAATADVFYEAESRTPLGTSATAVLAGASGAGSNTILQNNLVNAYQGVVSTQAAGGGAHLSQVGSYRVLARVYRPTTNVGEVSMKLAWTEGDFVSVNENDADEVRFGVDEAEGVFTIEDLGVVNLSKAPPGSTQRWEGRILAKSTVALDDIYVDWIWLVPTEEGSGEVQANTSLARPSSLAIFDAFDQPSGGVLTGKTAGIGGVYAGAGDTDDFGLNAALHQVERTAISDAAGIGRYVLAGATKYSAIVARISVGSTNPKYEGAGWFGLVTRYIDTNNWLGLAMYVGSVTGGPQVFFNNWYLSLFKKVAGVKTTIGSAIGPVVVAKQKVAVSANLELIVLANGEWRVSANGIPLTTGVDAALAAAGALKEGQVGLWDEYSSATAHTRIYDNLEAWSPVLDAAAYANRSLEIRNDQARRQDSAGVTWGDANYEGDYLLVPPAGREKAITRLTAKLSRNPESDGGIDDVKGQLYVTPRYLLAPPT